MEVLVELLFTFIRILILEILIGVVFYWIGWGVCKVVTFGRYPNSSQPTHRKNRDTRVVVVGIAVSLAIFLMGIYWG
jgi:hypothetical protein